MKTTTRDMTHEEIEDLNDKLAAIGDKLVKDCTITAYELEESEQTDDDEVSELKRKLAASRARLTLAELSLKMTKYREHGEL